MHWPKSLTEVFIVFCEIVLKNKDQDNEELHHNTCSNCEFLSTSSWSRVRITDDRAFATLPTGTRFVLIPLYVLAFLNWLFVPEILILQFLHLLYIYGFASTKIWQRTAKHLERHVSHLMITIIIAVQQRLYIVLTFNKVLPSCIY